MNRGRKNRHYKARRWARLLAVYDGGCNCYGCAGLPVTKKPGPECEYADHHCIYCHERGICTTVDCLVAFTQKATP